MSKRQITFDYALKSCFSSAAHTKVQFPVRQPGKGVECSTDTALHQNKTLLDKFARKESCFDSILFLTDFVGPSR